MPFSFHLHFEPLRVEAPSSLILLYTNIQKSFENEAAVLRGARDRIQWRPFNRFPNL